MSTDSHEFEMTTNISYLVDRVKRSEARLREKIAAASLPQPLCIKKWVDENFDCVTIDTILATMIVYRDDAECLQNAINDTTFSTNLGKIAYIECSEFHILDARRWAASATIELTQTQIDAGLECGIQIPTTMQRSMSVPDEDLAKAWGVKLKDLRRPLDITGKPLPDIFEPLPV